MTGTPDHKNRDHALLSASSAARWLACPPSAVAAEAYPNEGTDYTREGTLAHEVAELFARVQVIDGHTDQTVVPASCTSAEEAVTAEMQECAKGYADYIQEQTKSPAAVVLLEQRVDYSPWAPDGFGTADCIIIQGNEMDVIDYKYGKGVAVSAEDNPQMKLYGLGALNEFGFAYDVEKVRLHIYQPRINNVSMFELTADELQTWGKKTVAPIAQKAAKGKGTYKAGEHCRFCPHAGKCRTLTKTCTEYVETHGLKAPVQKLAPWEVADILAMEPVLNLWLKNVKDQALTSMMNGEEIPGYKVVAGRGSRAWTDEFQVADVLKAAGYSQEDITKTELLSVAAMEKALGKKKAAELLDSYIEKKQGAPTIAHQTDKREPYNRLAEAQKDFE